ncbi:MAG: hypothetical protein Q8P61_03340 [Candidatus Nanopelagicales bacterium]|nr:hypothetical protein [Candidatus Nanopelagicales bacterium]
MALATIGIGASDSLESSLVGSFLRDQPDTRCPQGMVFVSAADGFCIDRYEASVGDGCIYAEPASAGETKVNIDQQGCAPASVSGAVPWHYISQHEAQLACAKAGKHLATNREWYAAALGTPDSVVCNIDTGAATTTGALSECRSAAGAVDMVGNLWEWVDGVVLDGLFQGRTLPAAGYVAAVDEAGIPAATTTTPQDTLNNDRFWINMPGVQGMLRGGHFGGGRDAGIYGTYAASPPSFTGDAVGFRCAL